jgi:hypothetical protein
MSVQEKINNNLPPLYPTALIYQSLFSERRNPFPLFSTKFNPPCGAAADTFRRPHDWPGLQVTVRDDQTKSNGDTHKL